MSASISQQIITRITKKRRTSVLFRDHRVHEIIPVLDDSPTLHRKHRIQIVHIQQVSGALSIEHCPGERITIYERLVLRAREGQDTELSDEITGISVMLQMLDDSLASPVLDLFVLVVRDEGVVELARGVAEAEDLELGHYLVRELREEPVEHGGTFDAALRVQDQDEFLGGGG